LEETPPSVAFGLVDDVRVHIEQYSGAIERQFFWTWWDSALRNRRGLCGIDRDGTRINEKAIIVEEGNFHAGARAWQ